MKKKLIFFAALVILIIVFLGVLSTKFIKAEKIKDNIKLGNKYLQEGKYEEAILAFEKAIQVDKKNIDARVGIAKAYINCKEYDKAEAVLKEASKILTKDYSAAKKNDLEKKLAELKKKIPGNTPSNIANGGYVARQGEWLYYSNYTEEFNLFKIRADGSNKTRLNNEKSEYINVVDEGLYYIASKDNHKSEIIRLDIDGRSAVKLKDANDYKKVVINLIESNNVNISSNSEKENYKKLINDSELYFSTLSVLEDKMYYAVCFPGRSEYDFFGIIVSCNLDGTGDKVICKSLDKVKLKEGTTGANPYGCMVLGEWVYYVNLCDDSSSPLFRIKTDGTENSSFNDGLIRAMGASENSIYYITNSVYDNVQTGINKVSEDLKEKKNFQVANIEDANAINAFGDYIYYSQGTEIYRMKNDGSNNIKICNANNWPDIQWINVVDEWIYFGGWSYGDGKPYLCRVKSDGSGLNQVE